MKIYHLRIRGVTQSDAGRWACLLSNRAGLAACDCDVTVFDTVPVDKYRPATFTEVLQSITIQQDEKLTLTCKFTGDPVPTVEWYKDNNLLRSDSHIAIVQEEDGACKLTIPVAGNDDGGSYICNAVNVIGSASTEAQVTVEANTDVESAIGSMSDLMEEDEDDRDTIGSDEDLEYILSNLNKFSQVTQVEFPVKLRNKSMLPGKSVRLRCLVTGNPTPDVTWYQDGQEISEGEKYHMENDRGILLLVIDDLSLKDAGQYVCKANNGESRNSTTCFLRVIDNDSDAELKRPRFIRPLYNQVIPFGENAALVCYASGSPSPSFCWQKDMVNLEESDRIQIVSESGVAKFIISNVSYADTGLYYCIAQNQVGRVKCSARLSIREKSATPPCLPAPEESTTNIPKYEEEYTYTPEEVVMAYCREPALVQSFSESIQIMEGDRLFLECIVSGLPPPEVSWLRDGAILSNPDHCTTLCMGTQHAMEVASARMEDAGDYTIKVDSPVGSVEKTCRVTVQEYAENSYDEPDHSLALSLEPKSAMTSAVSIPSSLTDAMIQPMTEENRSAGPLETALDPTSPSSSLPIIARRDHCVKTLQNITQVPVFVLGIDTITVVEGKPAQFKCVVKGQPEPRVKWYKGDKRIGDGEYYNMPHDGTSWYLKFDQVSNKDAGEYHCKAFNRIEDVSSSATLVVHTKPKFITKLKSISVVEKSTAMLECVVYGVPDPDIKWCKDGRAVGLADNCKVVRSGNLCQLLFDCAAGEDCGNYSCHAVNIVSFAVTDADLEVNTFPKFTLKPQTTTSTEGKTVVFEVQSTGKPNPQIIWLKNGQPLDNESSGKVSSRKNNVYKLKFQKVELRDAGTYRCEATNCVGFISAEAQLIIHKLPTVDMPLENVAVIEGQSVRFECHIAGHPDPDVKWFKNGKPASVNERLKVSRDGDIKTLFLESVLSEDVGTYCCQATSTAGSTKTEAVLEVYIKPEITAQLQNISSSEGNSVVLECSVTGHPEPDIQWFRNGTEFFPSPGTTMENDNGRCKLTFEHVVREDEAVYCCQATNVGGSVSSEASVTVKVAPVITHPLTNQTVIEGRNIHYACRALGKPKPVASWMHDGKPLPENAHFHMEQEGNIFKLLIEKAVPKDAGNFYCEVENEVGSVSTRASLVVHTLPILTEKLQSMIATAGESPSFHCKFSGSPPPLNQWFKNSKRLKSSSHFKIKTDLDSSKLCIDKARRKDEAVYRCRIKNVAGSITTEAELRVNESPQFLTDLEAITTVEGSGARFECQVSGLPFPDIHWYKDGEVLQDQSHFHSQQDDDICKLVFEEVMLEDAGIYSMQASNSAGSVSSEAELRVNALEVLLLEQREEEEKELFLYLQQKYKNATMLDFPIKLKNKAVNEGARIRLQCFVTGVPEPTLTWYRGRRKIESSDSGYSMRCTEGMVSLVIKHASVRDVGQFSCEASNFQGSVTTTANIDVKMMEDKGGDFKKPFIVKNLENMVGNSGHAVTFHCEADGNPTPSFRWQKDIRDIDSGDRFHMVSDGGKSSLTIKDVELSDTGLYVCMAYSSIGRIKSSAKLRVRESPKLLELAPDLRGDRRSSQEIVSSQPDVPDRIPLFKLMLPKHINLRKGKKLTLTCYVTGSPQPIITWHKGSYCIQTGGRCTVSSDNGSHTLELSSGRKSDSGEYFVQATNDLGIIESVCMVTVKADETVDDWLGEFQDLNAVKQYSTPLSDIKVNGIKGDNAAYSDEDFASSDEDFIEEKFTEDLSSNNPSVLIDDSPEESIQCNSDSIDSKLIPDSNDAQITKTPTSAAVSQSIDCLPASANIQNENTSLTLTSEPVLSTSDLNAKSENKITTSNSKYVLPSIDTDIVRSDTNLHESTITKQASVDLPSQASLTKIGQLKSTSFNESIAESEEGDLDNSDNVKTNEDLLRQQSLDSVSTGYPSPVFIKDMDDTDGKAPDFKRRLFTQWTLLDGDVVMSVKVDSESDVDVVWFKDNSKIEEQAHYVMSVEDMSAKPPVH